MNEDVTARIHASLLRGGDVGLVGVVDAER
jgi:hypothetical protein